LKTWHCGALSIPRLDFSFCASHSSLEVRLVAGHRSPARKARTRRPQEALRWKSLPLYSQRCNAASSELDAHQNDCMLPASCPAAAAPPRVVLDTNVVLDWLLFRDAGCAALARQLQTGQLAWLATAAMRAELDSILLHPRLAGWQPDAARILHSFDAMASICAEAPLCSQALVCRDPDDQKFIDLAVAANACWLFSKDRALLALARRARSFGVHILRPDGWQA
jgi:putative PIN family toxin of toxin-antitoxin system